jgi:hypothetical protein
MLASAFALLECVQPRHQPPHMDATETDLSANSQTRRVKTQTRNTVFEPN